MKNKKTDLKDFWDNHINDWSSAYKKDYKNLSLIERFAHLVRINQLQKRQKFVLSFIKKKINNKKILELGCGNGVLSKEIIKLNPSHLTCVDISEKAINLTKGELKTSTGQIEYIIANIEDLEINFNNYDIIIGLGISQYLNIEIINKIFFSSKTNFLFDYINSDLSTLNFLHNIYRFIKFFGKNDTFPKYHKYNSSIFKKINKFNKDVSFLKKDHIYYVYYL